MRTWERPPILLVGVIGAAALLAGCGQPPPAGQGAHQGSPSDILILEPVPSEMPDPGWDEEFGELTQPVPPTDVVALIEQLQAVAGDSPDNGGPALEADGSVTLYWFGTLPVELQAVVAEYAETVPVHVVSTPLRPGDLRAEADRLIQEHAPTVRAVGPRVQGDGLTVMVSPAAVEQAGSLDAVLTTLDSPFPLFAEIGEVVPA